MRILCLGLLTGRCNACFWVGLVGFVGFMFDVVLGFGFGCELGCFVCLRWVCNVLGV